MALAPRMPTSTATFSSTSPMVQEYSMNALQREELLDKREELL
jgi:hypothetical protein